MRIIDHLDLTVIDPWASAPFYGAVLGFLGYRKAREHEYGMDFDVPAPDGWHTSIGLMKAKGEGVGRRHDRYSPGLHHVAFRAESRAEVDDLHALLQRLGATILDAPQEYPQYSAGYYAVFFADPDGLKLEFVYRP